MSSYEYSRLEDDLIYQIQIKPSDTYIANLHPPLRDLLIDRHNNSEELRSRISNVPQRTYYNYLRWIEQVEMYPFLYSVSAYVSSSSKYFDSLSAYYSQQSRSFDKFFPIAVRYTDNKNVWLIERPPFLATIDFKNSRSNSIGSPKQYSIWMPWTVMLLTMDPTSSFYEASLFFNDGPISSLEDKAVNCIYPNIYSGGRMCLNQTLTHLQQHLAETNSFDPATIYNFILNDYMTGGWNTDLGIGGFDKVASTSKTAAKARHTIIHGDSSQPKKYRSCLTPTGRVSQKKYIPNFLNYFSHAPLEEIMQMVTESKNSAYGFSTYQSQIESASQSVSRINPFAEPFNSLLHSTNSLYSVFHLYVDTSVMEKINFTASDSMNEYDEKICNLVFEYIDNSLSSEISQLRSNPDHSYYNSNPLNLYLTMQDDKEYITTFDPSIHDKDFFELKFPIKNQQVQNV